MRLHLTRLASATRANLARILAVGAALVVVGTVLAVGRAGRSGRAVAATRRAGGDGPTTAVAASKDAPTTIVRPRQAPAHGGTGVEAVNGKVSGTSPQPSPPGTPRCDPHNIRAVVVTDRPSYKMADTVTIKATLTNNGTAVCYLPLFDTVRITDASGTVVFEGSYPQDMHMPAMGHGQTTVNTTHWYHGQMCGPNYHPGCTQTVPPGTFVVQVGWLSDGGHQPPPIKADTSPFTLT